MMMMIKIFAALKKTMKNPLPLNSNQKNRL